MTLPLRSWHRRLLCSALAFLAYVWAPDARAQTCPIAATCTPGAASSPVANFFNMGILNVTLGTINNTTGGYIQGYGNFTCTTPRITATLLVGRNYPLSVRTNATSPENVRVWIDYNNDGAFAAGELVMTSNNAIQHTATVTPPGTATLGTALRMRVSADEALSPFPTACSRPVYSQVEDYSVTIAANSTPPLAAFTTSATTTCTGCIQFTDASQNVPTSWLWNFGDNTTSTAQNPSHCYTMAGTYSVTLMASNAGGNNTSPATAITYNTIVPAAATCSPATSNYCCNYGITRVRLGTIDNTSANGSVGYQDFSCTHRTSLIVGNNYPMTITTGGTNAHDTRVYLDQNNDGDFSDAGELIYTALNTASPSGNLNLPGTTPLNQPRRLRLVADAVGNNLGPCGSPVSGQIEDYTIVALANTLPPTAAFTSNYVAGACINPIQFTDQSTGAPTSWLWNFGDGATSTLRNPTHTYMMSGTYTVSLTATNANGFQTSTQANYATIFVPCLVYCASNGTGPNGGTGPQPSPFWITNVGVTSVQPAFSNPSANSTGGYGDYTNRVISVNPGQVTISVISNLNFSHRTTIWVDFDRDGAFSNTERVANGITSGANLALYTTTFTPPATVTGSGLTRMRIQCALNNNIPNPCALNIQSAEVEDYSFVVRPLATREAHTLPALTVYPNPTLDGQLHLHLADASGTGPYAATVENLLGATLLETNLRLATSADAELNLSSLPKGIYLLRLRAANGQTALRRVVRE